MEPQFRTSFIPKKPITTPRRVEKTSTVSVFSLVAIIVFIVSVALAGGSFFYQKVMSSRLEGMNEKLLNAKKEFEKETVERMTRFSKRIDVSKEILKNHVLTAYVFPFLEEETLENVRFSDFQYTLSEDNSAEISLSGEAKDFYAVALQSDVFGNSPYLKSPIFSGFKLTDKGTVSFDFKATIPSSVILYKDNQTEEKVSE